MRVAINGTGIAGPTLAYWLRRSGHEPVLLEHAPALRTGGYVIDFWGLGYEIAERMGIVPTLRERAYLMEGLRLVDADGRDDAALDLTPIREVLDGRLISLARADLAAALFGACAGIPVHFGVSVTALAQDGDGVVATLSDGRRERFDLVIGADGLHSRVRELAFGAEERFERSLGCWVAAFRVASYPRREELTYVSHTVPGRHVGRVSLRGDETLVLLVCRAARIDQRLVRERPKEALRHAFGDVRWEAPDLLARLDEVDDLYVDRVSQIHLPRWSAGRVALIGDAAACASLLAGEGTGLGMIEAYVLAAELDRAGGDVARGLAAYEARLRGFVTGKQRAAVGFRGLFAPRTAFGITVRNLAVRALAVRPLAKLFLARSLRDDLELPR